VVANLPCNLNLPDAEEFLTIITEGWADLPEEAVIELRCLFPERTPLITRYSPDPMGIDLLIDDAAAATKIGLSCYPVINPVRASAPMRRNGKTSGATDEDIIAARFCWADGDDEAATYAIKNFAGPKYTFAVTTGRTPIVRPHIYWRLEEWVFDLDEWSQVQRGIAAQLSTDKSVVNPSRIMRLPGTINWPTKQKAAKGRVPELVTLRTEYDDEREPVPYERMRRVFLGSAPKASQSTPDDPFAPLDLPAPLDRERARIQALSGQEWHNAVIRLVASYVSKGLSDDEIHGLTQPLTLAGYTPEETRQEVQTAIDGARRKGWTPEPSAQVAQAAQVKANAEKQVETPFNTLPVSRDDLRGIQPRRWLYGHKLLRGFVSIAVSPGGVGKSAWSTAMAADMAAGRKTLHDEPHGKLKTWIYNLEDPGEETRRRLAAIDLHSGLSDDDLSRLIVSSGRDRPLIVAQEAERGVYVVMPDVDLIIEACRAANVDVLIVDPAVRAHRLPENDNKAIDLMMDQFARIAHEADVAVLLIHHTRKGFVSGEMDSMRGASSMGSAARVVVTLQTMTHEEAVDMNVPEAERRFMVRVDNAKSNLAPPPMTAEWFRLNSQDLGNATAEYPDGDSVQVATAWEPPDPWADVGPVMAEIFARIERGYIHENGASEPFAASKQNTGDRYVANAVLASFPDGSKSEKQCMAIIRYWVENGLLEERKYKNAKGNERTGVFVKNQGGATDG
jgi:RecA-family ATPase